MPQLRVIALVGSTAGAGLSGATAAPSTAKAKPTVTTIAKKLVGPLSAAQAPDGTRYWTDSFAGPLYKQLPGGQPTVVFAGSKKAAAEGVSADGGVLRFTTGDPKNKGGSVWTLDANGQPQLIGDTYAYEKVANPDGAFDYGFLKTPKSCLAQLPKQVPGSYFGTQGEPPLRHCRGQRHHLCRRRRRQRDRGDLAHRGLLDRRGAQAGQAQGHAERGRSQPPPRAAPWARSTPSRPCRPTSRSALTASST